MKTLLFSMLFGQLAIGAEFQIVANHGPAGNYCAFPGVCRMADGRLICVYYNGTGHLTRTDQRPGGGAIAYTLSEDEGDNWSEPQMLLDTQEDDRDPSISLLRDGRLMLTYFRLVTVPKLAGDGVYILEIEEKEIQCQTVKEQKIGAKSATSESGEVTTRTENITRTRKKNLNEPRKLQHDAGCSAPIRDFGNGLLMLGSYHIDQPYILRSDDNGTTWQVFAIPNGGKHLDAETDVIQLANGQFYAIMRGTNCNGHYSMSGDGKNWSVAKDVGFLLHCPELHRVGKMILLTHRVPATAFHYSLDECQTWQGPVPIDSCGGAYPSMVTLKNGNVLVVYYTEGEKSEIRCKRLDLELLR